MRKEIPFSVPFIGDEEINEVSKVIRSKWITTGAKAKEFEEKVKEYIGVKHAIAVSSCTAALEISLAAHGVGPGDEVITTAYTFVSTVLAIIHCGAAPVFVDVDPETFNICPKKIEEKICINYEYSNERLICRKTQKILKGIIPVHFAGQSCEMRKINEIAKKYNLFVIEDAAHAIGAFSYENMIGKTQNLVCFSFYANKNITTGEGGMIVTDKGNIEEILRMYSLHGITKSTTARDKGGLPFYDVVYPGVKANMSDIQAALGVVQMGKLRRITGLRNVIAYWYEFYLKNDEGIAEGITIPMIKKYNYSARHLYPILLDRSLINSRDEIMKQLREAGINPSVHFIPVHFHSWFKKYFKEPLHLPVTNDLFYREISLPMYPELKEEDVKYISEKLKCSISNAFLNAL
jgi:dTDP-4-amino-4,6-dideoxygalactose transaminase